jgi:hypothetical protein
MPITDYRPVEAASVAPVILWRVRAWWSRLTKRGPDTVEGYKLEGMK